MIGILEHFVYSQNSINTYKSCPLKFKYKYIDNINWRKDDIASRNYYESLVVGSEFHLVCERYFRDIPLGIDNNPKFIGWVNKVKNLLPKDNDSKLYLPEYEIRYNLNGNIISAKYDLVVIKDNTIEIWDWKTESQKLEYKNYQSRMQTIVYMFLAKEVLPNLYGIDIDYKDIKMKYLQVEFEEQPITISYTKEVHEANKEKIIKYITNINNGRYDIKNEKHCEYCEFNRLCNNQEVKYEVLEEEQYEC